MEENLYGSRTPLTRIEYNNVYSATGLDVDGRREFFNNMIPMLDPAMEDYVAWSKQIPGFKDLSLNDQVKTLKGELFIVLVVSFNNYWKVII